jgi:hypothetical protein
VGHGAEPLQQVPMAVEIGPEHFADGQDIVAVRYRRDHLGVRKKYPYQVRLVLLAAGFVAHSAQIQADLRLVRASPAAKSPAPYLVHLFPPNALVYDEAGGGRRAQRKLDHAPTMVAPATGGYEAGILSALEGLAHGSPAQNGQFWLPKRLLGLHLARTPSFWHAVQSRTSERLRLYMITSYLVYGNPRLGVRRVC